MAEQIAVKLGLWNILVGTATVAAGMGLVVVFGKMLPPELPLWYSRPWGTAQLASPGWLWIVPGLALISLAASGVAHRMMIKSDPIMAVVICATDIVVQLLAILGLVRILFLIV